MISVREETIVKELLQFVGEDVQREGLRETPERVLKAWQFLTAGYKQDPADVLKSFSDGAENYDEMVFQGSIPMYSICEHHLIPFFGHVHIGYIPNGKIVGLSKLSRLVEVFARRLNVQERLTTQIANALQDGLSPLGVGVVVRCRHLCMESRGVQKIGTITTTSTLLGCLQNHSDARAEFMEMVSMASRNDV